MENLIGTTVKLKEDLNLVSFFALKGKELLVEGLVDTGLISQPNFLIVSFNGKRREINPSYLNLKK